MFTIYEHFETHIKYCYISILKFIFFELIIKFLFIKKFKKIYKIILYKNLKYMLKNNVKKSAGQRDITGSYFQLCHAKFLQKKLYVTINLILLYMCYQLYYVVSWDVHDPKY